MLALRNHKIKIINLNIRDETHGTKKVIACDLKFSAERENNSLAELGDSVMHMFYWDKKQPDLVTPTHAPNLREENIGQQKWKREHTGYRFILPYGIEGAEGGVIDLSGCKFNEIKFTPKEGGTVVYEGRLQFYTDATTRGLLSEFIGTEREATLIPPAAEEKAEGKKSRKEKKAAAEAAKDPNQSPLEGVGGEGEHPEGEQTNSDVVLGALVAAGAPGGQAPEAGASA